MFSSLITKGESWKLNSVWNLQIHGYPCHKLLKSTVMSRSCVKQVLNVQPPKRSGSGMKRLWRRSMSLLGGDSSVLPANHSVGTWADRLYNNEDILPSLTEDFSVTHSLCVANLPHAGKGYYCNLASPGRILND